ncbi:hypothetical protein ACQRXC_08180 [Niallia taxi]|uniref:hypothetical protein n=1 Tax=Niallia taxi TaxID=2499688 RepID=UPI003F63CC67
MGNEVSKSIYEQASEHLKSYLKVKETILDNEYVQLAGDVSKLVAFVRGANELIINKKFNSFLNGFTERDQPTEEQMKRLIEYIDDESKAEFISDTFSKVLLSNSSKSCLLMGTLLKSIVEEGGDIKHEKLVCISALTSFFDVDIINFALFFEFYHWLETKNNYNRNKKKKYERFLIYSLKEFVRAKGYNYSSLMLTIEKSVSSQLILRSYDADIAVTFDKDSESTDVDTSDIDEYYTINSSGLYLYDYIRRIL